ncbi:hypothetical protein I600_2904 [Maribacter dokdonensis DSW-8]|nr:hypothetical protein I600_2904 [Maribacter dokdonensis DSW-8]
MNFESINASFLSKICILILKFERFSTLKFQLFLLFNNNP